MRRDAPPRPGVSGSGSARATPAAAEAPTGRLRGRFREGSENVPRGLTAQRRQQLAQPRNTARPVRAHRVCLLLHCHSCSSRGTQPGLCVRKSTHATATREERPCRAANAWTWSRGAISRQPHGHISAASQPHLGRISAASRLDVVKKGALVVDGEHAPVGQFRDGSETARGGALPVDDEHAPAARR